MQIPNKYPKFEQPTYLVVTDHKYARLFLGVDRQLTEQETVTSNYPSKENVERTSMLTPAGMHSAEESENLQEISMNKLFHDLNKILFHRLQEEAFVHLRIAAPQDAMNELKRILHPDLMKRIEFFLPKNLIKHNPLAIHAQLSSKKLDQNVSS